MLDNFDEQVNNADKIIGVSADGVMQPVLNYGIMVKPLYEYILQLEGRIKALEDNT